MIIMSKKWPKERRELPKKSNLPKPCHISVLRNSIFFHCLNSFIFFVHFITVSNNYRLQNSPPYLPIKSFACFFFTWLSFLFNKYLHCRLFKVHYNVLGIPNTMNTIYCNRKCALSDIIFFIVQCHVCCWITKRDEPQELYAFSFARSV